MFQIKIVYYMLSVSDTNFTVIQITILLFFNTTNELICKWAKYYFDRKKWYSVTREFKVESRAYWFAKFSFLTFAFAIKTITSREISTPWIKKDKK